MQTALPATAAILHGFGGISIEILNGASSEFIRNVIGALAAIIRFRFQLDPYDKNTLLLFCGRRSDRIKGLLWEGDGFLLLYKRLDNVAFSRPRTAGEAMEITPGHIVCSCRGWRSLQSGRYRKYPTRHVPCDICSIRRNYFSGKIHGKSRESQTSHSYP